ncbi:MAG TPA: AMP nucleosidase [Actinomycetales bacterium]|nr:AMP nucleosidase [Actinomycetales bacterium]
MGQSGDPETLAGEETSESPYTHLVCPGEQVFPIGEVPDPAECIRYASASQMPAYHLVREDGLGVTIIDIGVGPSNAKTITDCLAVLRPHCWMMVGHCAGLDGRMRIGDMILANGYDRADGVLDAVVPLEKPIPPIAEVQVAVAAALRRVSGLDREALRKRLRTGTVLSTADRNWEWRAQSDIYRDLQKSTAIGVEMESATIAANGYRYRVPYGALLSISDMPLHDQPKLPKAARAFYAASKVEHLMAAVRACEAMSSNPDELHSRKLRRPVGEVAFR